MNYGSEQLGKRRNFLNKTEDYIRSYAGFTTATGLLIAAPIGFTAGFAGSLISDGGKFAYDSALYLVSNFPTYTFGDFIGRAVEYLSSTFTRALVTGLKDGFVAGIGGILLSRWIKRKLVGET